MPEPAPVVIGGTGGSGTRLVALLLRDAGVDLGRNVNASGDARCFFSLYERHVNACIENRLDETMFAQDLREAMEQHRRDAAGTPWGWKSPRSIYLVPVMDRLIPGLRFVHVVRNGLDMALSSNQDQLRKHGASLLGVDTAQRDPVMAAALLWQTVNGRAADYGERMGDRYFRVRYEDLCTAPAPALAAVCAALDRPAPDAQRWAQFVKPVPPRWTALENEQLDALRAAIGPTLARFGY